MTIIDKTEAAVEIRFSIEEIEELFDAIDLAPERPILLSFNEILVQAKTKRRRPKNANT